MKLVLFLNLVKNKKKEVNEIERKGSNISDNQVLDIANSIVVDQETELSKAEIDIENEIDTSSKNKKKRNSTSWENIR